MTNFAPGSPPSLTVAASKVAASKVLEKIRKQSSNRDSSTSSSTSSDDNEDSDSGSGNELRLSRYVTDGTEAKFDGMRGINVGTEQMNIAEVVNDGAVVDGPFPTASGHGARENGDSYGMGGATSSSSAARSSPNYGPATGGYGVSPLSPAHGSSPTSSHGWTQHPQSRSREGSATAGMVINTAVAGAANGQGTAARPQRPTIGRTPSNAYAPPRRPSQYPAMQSSRHSSSSAQRRRLNPDAEYRAQKKAYAQRLQQDNAEEEIIVNDEGYPPDLGYSTGSETEEDSPTTASYVENDPYDQETQLMFGHEDMSPSAEELKVPANRERLEWHSMLANVLTGDVVKQEKKRMTGATDQQDLTALRYDIWVGVRARCCGRPVPAHKRMLDDQRTKAPPMIEDIITFEIKGEAEVGKSSQDQVEDVVKKIEKIESLYPTAKALETAHARAASTDYKETCAAVIAWHSTTALINVELNILRAWVGNAELDFSKPRERTTNDSNLSDDSSFIDRILKEDGLKSLQGDKNPEKSKRKASLLDGVGNVIQKAKATLIANANVFANKHLPPYIEELLTLINFPSRLIQEIIRVRLSYAERIKDQAQQGVMIAEQMISQFQILLNLAVDVKEAYLVVSQPQSGWDLPPCIDENFDTVVLNAFQFYFKMLSWKLSANKNTFKEAEILEQEWGFLSALGRHFDGGDVEVAEQFSKLTAKALERLSSQFRKELQRRPNEVEGAEMDKRYKQILDSVRVRQRKLFRFSRQLTNTFENTTELSINMPLHQLQEIYDDLTLSGHVLVNVTVGESDKIYILASPSLEGRPNEIRNILGTCYRSDDAPDDSTNPYVLMLYPEEPLYWNGPSQDVDMKLPKIDIKPGKLRLTAQGGRIGLAGVRNSLEGANLSFSQYIGMDLDVMVPQRANFPTVDNRLQAIKKKAYNLSNTIMDSVDLIRKQLEGLQCQELIQTCFGFATEFGQRSVMYMDYNRRALNNARLTRLALAWVSFICDDCVAADRKTFRWAVVALEFAMMMTRGQNILSITDEEYATLRSKVAGCMSLLISHFDIMGARSTVAAQAEKQRVLDAMGAKFRLDVSKLKDDEESAAMIRERWLEQLTEIDEIRKNREAERRALGRVLEDSNEADRSLTFLSAAATNVTHRWQQGQYIGGGTFGSVYAATNLDSGYLMAVKEIRLQDPQMIPTIASQIRDEMGVLQILDHPNIVSYYGIEVHRDKVYIFMEYCSGGSLANLLEHGRIEDETVIMVYALQMLEGLAYLHESGVIHRDIKPENILLDHNGVIKYVDFGAAKVIARQNGRTLAAEHPAGAVVRQQGRQKSMTGTPMYMSPEVIRGSNSFSSTSSSSTSQAGATLARPGAVDIWSLGCVILEMATGRRPWASLDNEWAIMYNIAQGNPPQMPTRDQLSAEGIDFLRRCFERDPARRASAAELLQHEWIMRLRNQLSLEPTPATPSSEGGGSGGSSGTLSRSQSEVPG